MLRLSATRLASVLFQALISLSLFSQGPVTLPRVPSPAATVSQKIGISTISISYSRPSVKGREIWGALVPYGWNKQLIFGAGNDAPWRAGANENTVLHLSDDATVEGHHVPAGDYGLFFIINKDNSGEVVLSKDYTSWGSFWYDSNLDEMREKIMVRDNNPTELLTYEFINLTKTSAELVLNWEKKQFPVKIEFAVDDIVLANAKEELKNTKGFTWQGYNSAANYCLQNNIQYDQALKWADQAVAMNPSFTTYNTRSTALKQMGNTAESDKALSDAIDIATENELNTYGYTLLNNKQFDKAIEVLTLNTQRHPKSANVWDSLGEGYALKGDKKNAIPNFKKSLTLNPPPLVKANSEKYLKQLGAM